MPNASLDFMSLTIPNSDLFCWELPYDTVPPVLSPQAPLSDTATATASIQVNDLINLPTKPLTQEELDLLEDWATRISLDEANAASCPNLSDIIPLGLTANSPNTVSGTPSTASASPYPIECTTPYPPPPYPTNLPKQRKHHNKSLRSLQNQTQSCLHKFNKHKCSLQSLQLIINREISDALSEL